MLQRLQHASQAYALRKKEEAKKCAKQRERKVVTAASTTLWAEKGQVQNAKAGGSKDPAQRGRGRGRSTYEAPIG